MKNINDIWKETTTIKIFTLLCVQSSLLGGHVLIFFYQKHKKILCRFLILLKLSKSDTRSILILIWHPKNFMGSPKSIKGTSPLRPIVSSRGSINYEVAKDLSRILRTLVGKSPHHIKKLVTLYSKLEGSSYNQQKVLLHMMSQHSLHLCP